MRIWLWKNDCQCSQSKAMFTKSHCELQKVSRKFANFLTTTLCLIFCSLPEQSAHFSSRSNEIMNGNRRRILTYRWTLPREASVASASARTTKMVCGAWSRQRRNVMKNTIPAVPNHSQISSSTSQFRDRPSTSEWCMGFRQYCWPASFPSCSYFRWTQARRLYSVSDISFSVDLLFPHISVQIFLAY